MWHTPLGDRILTGPEASLFIAALADMLDALQIEAADETDEPWKYDVRVYDELPWPQRLWMLVLVGEALLLEHLAPPEFTAAAEGTIGAAYRAMRHSVTMEIEIANASPEIAAEIDIYRWRRMILACFDPPVDPEEGLPDNSCSDSVEWEILLTCLEDRVLWDEDWDMPEHFLDVDPETSRERRRRLDISDDYYMATVFDPREDEVPGLWERLRALTQRAD